MQLFHQNLRTFGGAVAARNAAFTPQFTAIGAAAAANPIGVAGFTEVMNNGTAPGAIAPFATGVLGAAPVFSATVCCGLMGGGAREFITIATSVAPVGIGRLSLRREYGGALDLVPEYQAAPGAWSDRLPEGVAGDYRGVVFVTVPNGLGANVTVGFIHNRYRDGAGVEHGVELRALTFEKIPWMLARMNDCGGVPGGARAAPAAVYLGGDFNVIPHDFDNARRYGAPHFAGLAAPPVLPPLPVGHPGLPAFVPGGTLWSGNRYDYWYSNVAAGGGVVAAPVPTVDGRTLDSVNAFGPASFINLMSDHCASLLAI